MRALESPSNPLPPLVRAGMEANFGHDFSDVRVHAGTIAANGAASVAAAAFTVGSDIVFGAGRYAPATVPGFGLLAHELVHVAQGRGGSAPGSSQRVELGRVDDPHEREADEAAGAVLAGTRKPVATGRSEPLRLRRTPSFSPECNVWRRCLITAALDAAKPHVDTTIKELGPLADGTVTSGRVVDQFRVDFKRFSTADAATVLGRFRLIRAELDAPIRYLCFDQPPDACLGVEITHAFTTCSPAADVGICRHFLVNECAGQVHGIVHELAHHFLTPCTDHAYAHQPDYATLTPEVALVNADSYARFADMVSAKAPTCKNCS